MEPIGREREQKRIATALRESKSMLILGPRGIGKSTLLEGALALDGIQDKFIRLTFSPSLHALLTASARQLREKNHPHFQRIDARVLAASTSIRLRGILLAGLTAQPWCVALEDVENAGPGLYRFAQQLFHLPGIPLLVTARSRAALGYLQRLFWNPSNVIELKLLTRTESTRLMNQLGRQYGLQSFHIDELRRDCFLGSRRNPGQIEAMCRLAADERYQRGPHLRKASIRMELATRFLN